MIIATWRRRSCLVAVLVGMAAAIAGLWWLTAELLEGVQDGPATLDEAVGSAAAAACWLCLAWLASAVVCSVVAALPGAVGRSASAVADLLAPWALRKALIAGLGLTVVSSPTATAAEPVHLEAGPAVRAMAQIDRLHLDGIHTDFPSLDRPAEPAYVTVGPGDCLWSIARRQLGPRAGDAEIAAAWPAWYAANRAVIGPDPNLLQPGQRLIPPG
jgi:hypothetical protein